MPRTEAQKLKRKEMRKARRAARGDTVVVSPAMLTSKSSMSRKNPKFAKHVLPGNSEVRKITRKFVREAEAADKYLTEAGAGWLERVTNPCAVDVICYGVPDNNSANVLTPNEREYFDLKCTDGDPQPVWHLNAEDPPVREYGIQPFDELSVWNAVVIMDASTYVFNYLIYQGDLETPTYLSTGTRELRLRKHAQIPDLATGSRASYLGSTTEFTGPTTQDQGELTIAQLKPDYVRVGGTDASEIFSWQITGNSAFVPTGTLEPEMRERMKALKDFLADLGELPQSISHKAKLGSYIIHKIAEPSMLFKDHNQAGADIQSRFADPLRAATTGYESALSTEITKVRYCDPYDLNAGIQHYTGISSQSSFRIKIYTQLEMTATVGSPMQYYVHKSPLHDENALDLAQRVLSEMPDGFVSAANAFGWLKKAWNKVKDVGSKILKPIIPSLGAAAGNTLLPGAGGALGGMLGNMVSGMLPGGNTKELRIM